MIRFFQRHLRPSRPSVRTLFTENHNSSMLRLNFNPLQVSQTYVPKCLSATSPSDILTGGDIEEVEDFSSGCWLQDHLHQFGNGITQLVTGTDGQHFDEDVDDNQTWSGSETSTELDNHEQYVMPEILGSYNNEWNHISSQNYQPSTISRYIVVEEAPPYGFDDPPPSYDEAIQSQMYSLTSLTDFDVLF